MRIALLLIVFIAGCSSMGQAKWTKEGSSPDDFDIASSQCAAEAVSRSNAIATHIEHFFYVTCMTTAGWTPPPAPKEEEHEEPEKTAAHDTTKHEAPAAEAPKH